MRRRDSPYELAPSLFEGFHPRAEQTMLSSIRRRLTRVEVSLPVPMTAERFYARAQRHANRTGGSLGDAIATLVKDLSDNELDSISAEFERLAFGSDRVACEAAKREVFADAGYPVWNLPSEESMEEGW